MPESDFGVERLTLYPLPPCDGSELKEQDARHIIIICCFDITLYHFFFYVLDLPAGKEELHLVFLVYFRDVTGSWMGGGNAGEGSIIPKKGRVESKASNHLRGGRMLDMSGHIFLFHVWFFGD